MLHAYCWASGLIQFGTITPRGAIQIATGDDKPLRDLICATSRNARQGESLLVPGIPEAKTEIARTRALRRYVEWISKDLPAGVSTIYSRPMNARAGGRR